MDIDNSNKLSSLNNRENIDGGNKSDIKIFDDHKRSFSYKIDENLPLNNEAKIKPLLNNILENFQVKKDKEESWTPKIFGKIPIPGVDTHGKFDELPKSEGKLLDNLGLYGLKKLKDIKDLAINTSESRYPLGVENEGSFLDRRFDNDGHKDAYRHTYASSLLTKEFGSEWSNQFTTAHEAKPGNYAVSEAMDLYNNKVGSNLSTTNPTATEGDLANFVDKLMKNGDLLVTDRDGNLAWSNQVKAYEHGTSDNALLEGKLPVPKGDVYPK